MSSAEQTCLPTPEDVARVLPSYTRGRFDDDSDAQDHAGEEQGAFTDTTSPTRTHVEGLIATAADEVEGRVGVEIPDRCCQLFRTTVIWHVAADIAGGKIPAGTDDARGEYSAHIANFRACLDELTRQCRIPTAMRLV